MGLLTTKAINGFVEYTKSILVYARYKIGGIYYKANIEKVAGNDGSIIIEFTIDHAVEGEFTVTEVQLFDNNNDLWLSKAEGIVQAGYVESTLYKVTIKFMEG